MAGILFDWHDILRIVQRMESPELAAGTVGYAREYIALTGLVIWLEFFLWKQPIPFSLFRKEKIEINRLLEQTIEGILPFSDWILRLTRFLDK